MITIKWCYLYVGITGPKNIALDWIEYKSVISNFHMDPVLMAVCRTCCTAQRLRPPCTWPTWSRAPTCSS